MEGLREVEWRIGPNVQARGSGCTGFSVEVAGMQGSPVGVNSGIRVETWDEVKT